MNKEYPAHLIKYDTLKFNTPMISFVGEGFKSGVVSFAVQAAYSIGSFFSNIFSNNQGNNQNSAQIINNTDQNNIVSVISETDNQAIQEVLNANKNIFNKISVPAPVQQSANIKSASQNQNSQIALINNNLIQKEQIRQIATTTQQIMQSQQITVQQCDFATNQSPNRQKTIINEIAWMGTTESANNEWIELKNISGNEINLNGWQLIDQGEQIKITFENNDKISANSFYLLERTDDNSVANIKADKIYTGALSNTNEGLRLFDNQCNLIDEVLANSDWQVGDNSEKRTMERDLNGFNWHTSSIINGTPKKENSSAYVVYSGGGGGSVSVRNSNGDNSSSNIQTTSPPSSKILINEIQITGGSGKTDNDFIELYNPNNFEVNFNGYRLVKRTQGGRSDTSIKSWTSDTLIPANGYYLWANNNYSDISASPDITTSATISSDNGIALRYGPEDTGEIIDSVGWGAAQNVFIEGAVFSQNPGANQSIQRKSFFDTGNNADDFELQTCPSPKAQNAICQSA